MRPSDLEIASQLFRSLDATPFRIPSESSFSTTNLTTCARSLAGRALNCSITSVPLMAKRIFHQIDGRKIDLLLRLSSQPSTTCHAEVRDGGSAVAFWIILRSRSRSGVTSRSKYLGPGILSAYTRT